MGSESTRERDTSVEAMQEGCAEGWEAVGGIATLKIGEYVVDDKSLKTASGS